MKKKRRLQQSDLFWGGLALLLIILQFWWLPGEDGSAGDSFSNTIDGKLGLYRTLGQLFPDVTRDTTRVVPNNPRATLLLIAPDRYPTTAEEQELYQYVYNGGNLLFAPRWLESAGLMEQGKNVELPTLGIRISPRSWMENAMRRMSRRNTPAAVPITPNGPEGSKQQPSALDTASPGMESEPQEVDINAPVDSVTTPVVTRATDDSPANVPPENPPLTTTADAVPVGTTPDGTVPDPSKATILTEEDYGDSVNAQGPVVSGSVELRTTGRIILPNHSQPEVLLRSGETIDIDAATWQIGSGRVVVCSTADIFSNRSMLYTNERRLAVRLVERCALGTNGEVTPNDTAVVIGEFFNASDAYQNGGILFSPAMRIGSLQLLLITVLSIWMAFHRFGPAQHVTNAQRRSLTESAEAVGNLQYRLSDGAAIVHGYLEYIRSQLRRRYGSVLRLDQPDAIANRAAMDPAEVKQKLREAHELARTSRLSASESATMIRWLSRLQQRLSGKKDDTGSE